MTAHVRGGYAQAKTPTVAELTCRLEAARDEMRAACSRYSKLRAAVLTWAESRGLEAEGAHLHSLLREVGRQPGDGRTEVERAMDGPTFLGAHSRMRGR